YGARLESSVPLAVVPGGTTCKRQRHTAEANSVSTLPTAKAQLGKWRTFSRAAYRRSTEVLIDFWAMRPTRRMRFRTHFFPLTSTWTSSGGIAGVDQGYRPFKQLFSDAIGAVDHAKASVRRPTAWRRARALPAGADGRAGARTR